MPDSPHLHERLLRGDPTAPADLAAAYFDPLIAWLRKTQRAPDPDLVEDAAGRAIIDLCERPNAYQPDKMTLQAYLRMSALGDLRNLLAVEGRRRRKEISLAVVEQGPDAGKYLGRADDPAAPLQAAEENGAAQAIVDAVRCEATKAERAVLELLLRGERRTSVHAVALGVAHLPKRQQFLEVKKVKDRLKKRLERARRPQ